MLINWPVAQSKLGVTPDGRPGPVTYGKLIDIVGNPCQPVADCLAKFATSYGMTTPARLSEFLAQIANETGGFIRWEENLNYRASVMLSQWPSHFTPEQANAAVGHPVEIASRAYGGRNGNAPYPSQDGFTYRGRGALQLTGKANYAKFGRVLGLDLVTHPELASDPYNSCLIALEFFKEGDVNSAVDAGNFKRARQITNGPSAIGLDHVAELRAKLLAVLA